MSKKDWATRISYSGYLALVTFKVFFPSKHVFLGGASLFKRTDRHEDGSETVTYGIEVSKDEYKKLKELTK